MEYYRYFFYILTTLTGLALLMPNIIKMFSNLDWISGSHLLPGILCFTASFLPDPLFVLWLFLTRLCLQTCIPCPVLGLSLFYFLLSCSLQSVFEFLLFLSFMLAYLFMEEEWRSGWGGSLLLPFALIVCPSSHINSSFLCCGNLWESLHWQQHHVAKVMLSCPAFFVFVSP